MHQYILILELYIPIYPHGAAICVAAALLKSRWVSQGAKKPLIPGPASVETSRPLFKLLAELGDGVIHVREFQQDKWWYNGGINDGVMEI